MGRSWLRRSGRDITRGLVWSSSLWVSVVVWHVIWLLFGAWSSAWAVHWSVGS